MRPTPSRPNLTRRTCRPTVITQQKIAFDHSLAKSLADAVVEEAANRVLLEQPREKRESTRRSWNRCCSEAVVDSSGHLGQARNDGGDLKIARKSVVQGAQGATPLIGRNTQRGCDAVAGVNTAPTDGAPTGRISLTHHVLVKTHIHRTFHLSRATVCHTPSHPDTTTQTR